MNKEKAYKIFGFEDSQIFSLAELKKRFRKLAKEKHPDSEGGNDKDFLELKDANSYLEEICKTWNISDSTDLKTLSKDEILKKYYDEKDKMENVLGAYRITVSKQTEIIQALKGKVKGLINDFEKRKEILQKELESEIAKLEKKYSGNVMQKFLFFLPKMSEQNFWKKYQIKVDEYAKMHTELDIDFFKEMLGTYGDGLNKIGESISQNESED